LSSDHRVRVNRICISACKWWAYIQNN